MIKTTLIVAAMLLVGAASGLAVRASGDAGAVQVAGCPCGQCEAGCECCKGDECSCNDCGCVTCDC